LTSLGCKYVGDISVAESARPDAQLIQRCCKQLGAALKVANSIDISGTLKGRRANKRAIDIKARNAIVTHSS